MNLPKHEGINFGASYRIPANLLKMPPTHPDGTGVDEAIDQPHRRLRRRISRRSRRFKHVHRHREGFVDNPFIVKGLDAHNSSTWQSKMGYDFVVMKPGVTVQVEINDRPHDQFFRRRFLTPHLLEGASHVQLSDWEPDFLRRRIDFKLAALNQGLVRILALDMRGRCLGELVLSIKDFSRRFSVRFVRVHNGENGAGQLKNGPAIQNTQITRILRDADRVLRRQTGLSFVAQEPPLSLEITSDVSTGLSDPVWQHLQVKQQGNADFTVYLFAAFNPGLLGSDANGISIEGQLRDKGFSVIALSDTMFKGQPHRLLAHEMCHALIPKSHRADLGFDSGGHFSGGLMDKNIVSSQLRWREVNVINPTGLGNGGLAGLIARDPLWKDSGS